MGDAGEDLLAGGEGHDDTLAGGAGANTLADGAGSDLLVGNAETTTFFGAFGSRDVTHTFRQDVTSLIRSCKGSTGNKLAIAMPRGPSNRTRRFLARPRPAPVWVR